MIGAVDMTLNTKCVISLNISTTHSLSSREEAVGQKVIEAWSMH